MILVRLEDDADRVAIRNTLLTRGYVKEWGMIPLLLGFAGPDDALDWIKAIPGVHSAEVETIIHLNYDLPITPGWTDDQGQLNIVLHGQKPGARSFNSVQSLLRKGFRARFTYDPVNNGTGVIAYVVDGGIAAAHPQFSGRSVTEIFDAYSAQGPNFHGTWVAAALGGNTQGVATGVTFIDAKAFPTTGGAPANILVDAMNACLTHFSGQGNPGVMNCSFGGQAASDAYSAVLLACVNAGLVVVASAGNDGLDLAGTPFEGNQWPAENPNSFTVGGVDHEMRRERESNFGGQTDMYAAYGHWTLAGRDGGSTIFRMRGTSFAGPMVAGMMCRVLQGTTKMTSKAQVDAFKAQFLLDYGVEDVMQLNRTPYTGQRRLWIPDVVFDGWEPWTRPTYLLPPPAPITVDHARTYTIVGRREGQIAVDHARTYVIVDEV